MAGADDVVVLRDDDARVADLERAGWHLEHGSWGAWLRLGADRSALEAALRVPAGYRVAELAPEEDARLIALDAATAGDYPGGPATAHAPFDAATLAEARTGGARCFGAWAGDELVALTVIRPTGEGAAERGAETDVTVVARDHRGRGLATAVKAASVLALAGEGVHRFGTGGSDENLAILAANRRLGYEVVERWRTHRAPRAGEPPDGPRGLDGDPCDRR